MALALLSFFVGFALLLLVLFVWIGRERDRQLNAYFLLILAVAGTQRFLQGVEAFELVADFTNPFKGSIIFQFFMFVVCYLFFYNLVLKTTSSKKAIIHFIFPTLVALVSILFDLQMPLIQGVFLLFSTLYIGLTTVLLWRFTYQRKNFKELIHFRSIKIWAYSILGIYILIFMLSNFVFLNKSQEAVNRLFVQFYYISSLIWFFIVLYILKNPVILYVEQQPLKKLNSSAKEGVIVWRSKKKAPTEKEDLDVERKVKDKVDEIIHSLKNFENEVLEELETLPTMKELSIELGYPQSHLKYVFTYYSYCTYSEYHTVLKIKFALKMIKSGYLDRRTVDSLTARCLFSNRSTFYRNFKKFTGFTPTEYHAELGPLAA